MPDIMARRKPITKYLFRRIRVDILSRHCYSRKPSAITAARKPQRKAATTFLSRDRVCDTVPRDSTEVAGFETSIELLGTPAFLNRSPNLRATLRPERPSKPLTFSFFHDFFMPNFGFDSSDLPSRSSLSQASIFAAY